MSAYPCPVCGDYRCPQQHDLSYMDDGALLQMLLKGFEEMLRRSNNSMGMMDSPPQYIYSPAYPPMIYPPTFNTNAAGPSGAKDVDALIDQMQNACISPPAYSADIWAAQGSASAPHYRYPASSHTEPYQVASEQGLASFSQNDMLASWAESYASVPQDAEHGEPSSDEDISYTEQHVNPVAPPFVPTSPGRVPVPSITVIEHLEQGTSQHKHLVRVKGTPAGPIDFNGGLGVSYGELDALADGAGPAFIQEACIGLKAYILFELVGLPVQPLRQVRVRHGGGKGREGQPFTLREMGERVFGELKKLMDHAKDSGEPLRHHGVAVDIERVVLLRVDHVSQGSLKPILGIRNNG